MKHMLHALTRLTTSARHKCRRHVPVLATLALCAPLHAASPEVIVNCIDKAAVHHGVNNFILRAIAWQESRGNPRAFNKNENGSHDIGMMQINTVHQKELEKYGIRMDHLYDPCVAAYVAAWHYKRQIERYGNTWDAVGAYHSHTPALRDKYARQIRSILTRWGVVSR